MSRFCKTHLGERTDEEIREKLANDYQLIRLYGKESTERQRATERIARCEAELRKRSPVGMEVNAAPNPETLRSSDQS